MGGQQDIDFTYKRAKFQVWLLYVFSSNYFSERDDVNKKQILEIFQKIIFGRIFCFFDYYSPRHNKNLKICIHILEKLSYVLI